MLADPETKRSSLINNVYFGIGVFRLQLTHQPGNHDIGAGNLPYSTSVLPCPSSIYATL